MKVGILGGGQLALMLVEAATKQGMGVRVWVLSPDDPVCKVTDSIFLGDPSSDSNVLEFSKGLDVIVYESEFWDLSAWNRLATKHSFKLAPALPVMLRIRDKLNQKEILWANGLPTAPFLVWNAKLSQVEFLKACSQAWSDGFVIKWGREGYDGKGVFLMPSGKNSDPTAFMNHAKERGLGLYAEQLIPFKRELSKIGCLSTTGSFISYPLTIHESQNGVCLWVKGPAVQLGSAQSLEDRASALAHQVGSHFGLLGTFAVEMFETNAGEILINEISPRVHNTGHYTQDACETSQFENHWNALCGRELGAIEIKGQFAMLNLLGPDGLTMPNQSPPPANDPLKLHWYAKQEIKPRRKLGHLNGWVKNGQDFGKLLEAMQHYQNSWESDLRLKR